MTMEEQTALYKEDLELLPDKDAKMEYILDFGKEMTGIDPQYKTDDNVIRGCSSLAWLHKEFKDGRILLEAEGDSVIARGMLTMLLGIFNNRTPEEILAYDPKQLMEMGVMELLSPVRQQGLEAFLNVLYSFAKRCKEEQP